MKNLGETFRSIIRNPAWIDVETRFLQNSGWDLVKRVKRTTGLVGPIIRLDLIDSNET